MVLNGAYEDHALEGTYHRIFPPSTATGIPLMMSRAPKMPYAGSILMLNGIQSSPAFHGSASVPVTLDIVPLLALALSTVVLLVVPLEKVVEFMVSVRTRVDEYAEPEAEAEGEGVMTETRVVVITWRDELRAVAEGWREEVLLELPSPLEDCAWVPMAQHTRPRAMSPSRRSFIVIAPLSDRDQLVALLLCLLS